MDIITAFQVVEHIEFDDVLEICKEAMRVLTPCGILILETPNPENIMVSTQWFYLDTTHKKPIPCELLAFATEYCGFKRNFVFRLNGYEIDFLNQDIKLFDIFDKVSLDYSVIAQKDGEDAWLFDLYFDKDCGIRLDQILGKYSDVLYEKLHKVDEIENIKHAIDFVSAELKDMYLSKSFYIIKPLGDVARLYKFLKKSLLNIFF